MREIRFRGKRLDNGEWVDGIVLFKQDKSEAVIYRLTATEFVCEIVDPATVGQFTGLHDKYGEEIYEGDIIDFISPFFRDLTYPSYPAAPVDPRHHYQCVVVWNERDCGFGLVSPKEALINPYEQQPVGITQISDSYLIGNIYDNPELLKTE